MCSSTLLYVYNVLNRPAAVVFGCVLVLVVPWCFGLFAGHGFPIARVSKQLSFYEVRMSVSCVFMLLLMRIFHQNYNTREMFELMLSTTLIILRDQMLVSKMYWQMV